jgi:hypothetical protein
MKWVNRVSTPGCHTPKVYAKMESHVPVCGTVFFDNTSISYCVLICSFTESPEVEEVGEGTKLFLVI